MKGKYILTGMVMMAILFVGSCEPLEKVSNIPEIHFKKITEVYSDQSGDIPSYYADLTFSFVDGNSDFGSDIDKSNLFLIPFQKLNGQYESVDSAIYSKQWKILYDKYLDMDGTTVRGEILVPVPFPVLPPFDTMRYDFYIVDRAGNKSNVESTSDLAIPK